MLKDGNILNFSPEQVFSLIQQYIKNTTSILVNGVLYKVNPDNVKV
jgi:hypothetical protein